MSEVPIEIAHELTVANVSDKSLRQGNRLWLLFASKMNCSPCIRLAVSLHPLRNLPATSAAFSLLGAKREMLITNCRLNRIRYPISGPSLHLAYFSLQFANGGFRPGQKQKNLLAAEGDPLMHSKECLSRRLRPALRPSDTRGASPFGPVGDNEISSSFLEMDGFRPKSGLRKTPSARRWRVTRRWPRGLPRCPRVVDPPLQASVSQ